MGRSSSIFREFKLPLTFDGRIAILPSTFDMTPSSNQKSDLLQGTLDMLILKALSLGPLHGYGVLLRIQQISQGRLQIQQGSLYPALYRLEHQGIIASDWGESENKRKARYYRLTAAGRKRFKQEIAYWQRLSDAIGIALKAAPEDV